MSSEQKEVEGENQNKEQQEPVKPQEQEANENTPLNEKEKNDQNEQGEEQPESDEKATVFEAQINLFKGLVGLGVIALPVGFSQAGWIVGLVLIPIVGYVMYYCATLMLEIADNNNLNPKDIVEFAEIMFTKPGVPGSGGTMGFIVTFFLFCLQLGVCIGYTIFFMNYFQESFCHFGWEEGCSNRVYSVLFSLLIVLPLGLIRNIKHLKTPSNIANFILLFAIFVMLYECYTEIQENGSRLEKSFDFWGISSYIGIVVFTLEGVGLFFNIRHSMKEPKEFKPALLIVEHCAIILYCSVGFVGYMAFGSNVKDLLLFNLPMDNDFYFSIQIFYSLVLCLSFPLQLFPVADYIEHKIKNALFIKPKTSQNQNEDPQNDDQQANQDQEVEQQQDQQQNNENQMVTRENNTDIQLTKEETETLTYYSYGMRIALTLGIFSIAMTLTKVSVFLNLAGSIGGIALLYLIPVIIYNMKKENIDQKTAIINWVISGVGLFAGLCGIYISLMEIKADMENGFDLFFL